MRRVILLRLAAVLGLLVLGGLLWLNRWEARRREAVAAELRRSITLANRLLVQQQERLLGEARVQAQNAKLAEAVAAGKLGDLPGRMLQTLGGVGAEMVWICDASGRRLASCGVEPPFGDGVQKLVGAGLRGHNASGIVTSGSWFTVEAVVPLVFNDGTPPVGVLRVARRLDERLIAEVESLTGAKITAAPKAALLGPSEMAAEKPEPGALIDAPERANEVLRSRFEEGDKGPTIVQQFRDLRGQPAGLLTLSLRDPGPTWYIERGITFGWVLICALLGAVVVRGLLSAGWRGSSHAMPLRVVEPQTTERGGKWSPTPVTLPVNSEEGRALRCVAENLNHHLNNALAVVIGNTELLKDGSLSQFQLAALADMSSRSWYASDTVRRLLKACSREAITKRHPVALDAACREAWARVGERRPGAAQRTLNVRNLMGLEASGLFGDLVEVLYSLLENAVEATEPGGTIEVIGERVGRHVQVVVSDDGHGMNDEVRAHAADLFYSTRGPQRVGLGLAVVDGIISRHGGQWKLSSEPDGGCRLTFELPAWSGRG